MRSVGSNRLLLFAIGLILLGRSAAFANAEDDSRVAIENRRIYARVVATHLVDEDFARIITNVVNALVSKWSEFNAASGDIEKSKRSLLRSLEGFSVLSVDELTQKKVDIRELRARYIALSRERYRLSWRATEVEQKLYEIEPLLTNALTKLDEVCRVGRSDSQIDIKLDAAEVYKPQWRASISSDDWKIRLQAGEEGPKGSQRSQDMQGASDILTTAGAIALKFGPAGAIVGGIAYTGAGILNITNHFLNSGENNEFLGDLNRAAQFRFWNWQRDADFANYYRESCKEHLEVLALTKKSVSLLAKGGEDANRIRAQYREMSSSMLEFEKTLDRQQILQARWVMRTELAKGHRLNPANIKKYGLENSEQQKQSDLVELRKLSPTVDRSSLLKYAVWKSVGMFDFVQNQLAESSTDTSWRDLDEVENKAFNLLLKYASLFEQMKQDRIGDKGFAGLIKEDGVRTQILKTQGELIALSGIAIRYSFDQTNGTRWMKARDAFCESSKDLFYTEGYRSEVRDLEKAFTRLVQVVEEK